MRSLYGLSSYFTDDEVIPEALDYDLRLGRTDNPLSGVLEIKMAGQEQWNTLCTHDDDLVCFNSVLEFFLRL